jgi:septum formation protein
LYISNLKSLALRSELKENEVSLCADTIVCIEEVILGKPKNTADATAMLKQLSGKTHKVITAVNLTSLHKEISFAVTTEVTFKKLTDSEINHYVTNFKPFDKAGAYGIQEWIGFIGVQKIKGSYFNVVGLPVHEVYENLLHF